MDQISTCKLHQLLMNINCSFCFVIFATPEQAAKMAALSDGAMVGSAIIKILAQYKKESPKYVGEYVKKMKDAVMSV